ncbi:MAG: hypothetical protein ACRELD_16915, partial [Longimicrobiales bacterium]
MFSKVQQNPTQVLVLDERGTVLANNEAWRAFAYAHPIGGAPCDVGSNYLEYCRHAAVLYDEASATVFHGIAEWLQDTLREPTEAEHVEFAIPAEGATHWYTALVSRFNHGGEIRVVLAYDNVTAERTEQERERVIGRLSELIEWEEDCAATYDRAARLAVPSLGDACWIDALEDGRLVRRALAGGMAAQLAALEPGRAAEIALTDAGRAQQSAVDAKRAIVVPELGGEALSWVA